MQCEEMYSNCSESNCGETGNKTCSRHCREYNRTGWQLIGDFDEICDTEPCVTACRTTPAELPVTVSAGKSYTNVDIVDVRVGLLEIHQ